MESLSLETGAGHPLSEWESIAAAVLRKSGRLADGDPDGAVWDLLGRRTLDGIVVSPLGTPALDEGILTSGRPSRVGDWDVRSVFADPDPAATAEAVLVDLENGATSLWLQLGEYGVPVAELGAVLQHVLLEAAPVVLDAPGGQLEAAQAFATLARGRELAPGTNLGADPIGAAVRLGGLGGLDAVAGDRSSADAVVADAAGLASELGCRALVVDATVVHDVGASDVHELGYALTVGATYLRALAGAGYDVETAAGLIEFRLAATDEQFPTIAKLRAVRRLWARVLELSGVQTAPPMRLHAVTSRPMMSKYDPWVNMLRTCIASFAAGVAGADAVTVLPFDAPLGLPDAFSRRIARNTSALLISESHVAAVADPAGGSHVVEKLTDDIAVAAWAEFGRLEGPGIGGLAERIEAVAAERDEQIARRKRPLTGLSEFPNLHEALPERTPYPAGGQQVRSYGHAFEALRDEPPSGTAFLATMGSVAAHTARATFATNLFAAGGIAVVNEGRHDDVDAVLAHYSGQAVVCLAGADTAYAEWGAPLVAALRSAGARWVVLAGKPVDGVEVDDTCATGLDALDFLTRTRLVLSHDEGENLA